MCVVSGEGFQDGVCGGVLVVEEEEEDEERWK